MKYKCIQCNYCSTDASNFARHNSSKKHLSNVKVSKHNKPVLKNNGFIKLNDDGNASYVCRHCDTSFSYMQSLSRHIPKCKKKKNIKEENNSHNDDITIDGNETLMKKILEEITNLKKEKNNDVCRLEEKVARLEAERLEILELAKINSKNTRGALKIATDKFKNAPVMKKIDKKSAIKMITYKPDDISTDSNSYGDSSEHSKQKKPAITTEEIIIHHFKRNTLVKYVGDSIVEEYKKTNPKHQSVWECDGSRLSFIVKDYIGTDGKSEWLKDKNGKKILETIIDPIYLTIKELMVKYLKKCHEKNKRTDIILTRDETDKLIEHLNSSAELIKKINEGGKMQKKTLKYIGPYFEMDMTKYPYDIYTTDESYSDSD